MGAHGPALKLIADKGYSYPPLLVAAAGVAFLACVGSTGGACPCAYELVRASVPFRALLLEPSLYAMAYLIPRRLILLFNGRGRLLVIRRLKQ